LTKSITIEGWLKLNSGNGYVLQRSLDVSPWLGSYDVGVFGGNVFFTIWFNSNQGVGVFSDPIPLGQFVHFAATLDDNSGRLSMYINGNLVRQFTTIQRANVAAGATVKIGNIDGITDELSVYNRALSASEILAIYNAGSASSGATGKCLVTSTLITIQSNPVGRSVSIDGGPAVITPQVVNWTPGSVHTIATTSPQAGSAGTQFVWSNWSDGGAISHSVTAPAVNTTYTANFTTQFLLTMNAGTGGSVLPATGFFNSGQIVQISASANPGFSFTGWTGTGTGSFTGNTNPVSVTMNGPISETAAFSQNPVQITVQTNPAGRMVSIDGGSAVTAPQVVQWQPGSVHTITTTSPQAGSNGTQFVWSNWSDGGAISHSVTTPAVNTTYTANFTIQFLLKLLLEEAGPTSNQVVALDSVLFLRDPFPVVNPANFFNFGNDRNTRLLIFVANLQLAPGESPTAVVVNLVDSNNQTYDIAADNVWTGANSDFSQVTFRLPDGLPPGTGTITVKLHGLLSNAGTIRIKP
ncbi:MAG TPA: LamG-like jellyroll fold domain-containing protein, partial [Pyrinomonadaceae bacterium]|nr:LamG-like jellyroll fold domain-containing protein [Pyrinomonadaceae bacterium]